MLNIAMLSDWHVHSDGYAHEFMSMDDAKVTCVWDEDPERGSIWAKELGVDFEPDLDVLLARKDVDAVSIGTPTAMHPEVMIKAARAGKHIFTEKVMALNVADCDQIAEEINKAGVKFVISFPQRSWGRYIYIKNLIDQGKLGKVTVLRSRDSHDGAVRNWLPDYWYDFKQTGGGAMMDLGAHPMYLSRWMMGKPKRINSMFTYVTGREVDDNAVCTIEYENGATVIAETSLVSGNNPQMFEVYGTKGLVLCRDKEILVKLEGDKEFHTPEIPADDIKPTRKFVEAVLYDRPIDIGLKEARDLTELMEKAYQADREKREIGFDD